MTQLPAEGRQGPAPDWPLPVDRELRSAIEAAEVNVALLEGELAQCEDADLKSKLRRDFRRAAAALEVAKSDLLITEDQELTLWATLWKLPQAVAWEKRSGKYLNEVAQYVRWKVRGELGDLKASKEARLLSKELGLTPASLLHLRWEIVADELAERRGEPDPEPEPVKRAPAKRSAKKPDPRSALRLA